MPASLYINVDDDCFCAAELTHVLLKVSFTCLVAAQVDEEIALWSSLIAKAQYLSAKRFPPWLQATDESSCREQRKRAHRRPSARRIRVGICSTRTSNRRRRLVHTTLHMRSVVRNSRRRGRGDGRHGRIKRRQARNGRLWRIRNKRLVGRRDVLIKRSADGISKTIDNVSFRIVLVGVFGNSLKPPPSRVDRQSRRGRFDKPTMNRRDEFARRWIIAKKTWLSRTAAQMYARQALIGHLVCSMHDFRINHASPYAKAHHIWSTLQKQLVRTIGSVTTKRQSVTHVDAVTQSVPSKIARK